MSSELTLVMLYVRDLPKSVAFYTEMLGLERVEQFSGSGFVFLKPAKGTPIALQDAAALPPGASAQPGGFQLGFEVADVDAALAEWREKGADVVTDITDMGAGRMFVARDPEGNLLSITQLHEGVRATRDQLGL